MSVAYGVQQPRFSFAPATSVGNSAQDAIDLCAQIGMPLDEWQQIALRLMLGEELDGSWSAQEFGIVVARQNGKNAVLEARELAGLFLFDEPRIVHSAHQSATAEEAFKRMANLIESAPDLDAEVSKIVRSPGRQAILFKSGQELSYRTRTKGGARGFSAPIVVFDEAQELTGDQLAAIMPVVSSFPDRQLIYTGTVLGGAMVFRGLVQRGRDHIGARLGYAEWSADEECESDDVNAMLRANPSIGIRIELPYVQNELTIFRAAGEEQKWREERLSIWPKTDEIGSLIPVEPWAAGEDTGWAPPIVLPKPYGLGIAVAPDRSWASIGFACYRPDGKTYVEVLAQERGVDWVLPWIDQRREQYPRIEWLIDQGSPASTLEQPLKLMEVPIRLTTTPEWKAACAGFVDDVVADRIRHMGQPELTVAANGVKQHIVGDQWVYARRDSGVLVAPLEAVTLARFALGAVKPAFQFINLNDY